MLFNKNSNEESFWKRLAGKVKGAYNTIRNIPGTVKVLIPTLLFGAAVYTGCPGPQKVEKNPKPNVTLLEDFKDFKDLTDLKIDQSKIYKETVEEKIKAQTAPQTITINQSQPLIPQSQAKKLAEQISNEAGKKLEVLKPFEKVYNFVDEAQNNVNNGKVLSKILDDFNEKAQGIDFAKFKDLEKDNSYKNYFSNLKGAAESMFYLEATYMVNLLKQGRFSDAKKAANMLDKFSSLFGDDLNYGKDGENNLKTALKVGEEIYDHFKDKDLFEIASYNKNLKKIVFDYKHMCNKKLSEFVKKYEADEITYADFKDKKNNLIFDFDGLVNHYLNNKNETDAESVEDFVKVAYELAIKYFSDKIGEDKINTKFGSNQTKENLKFILTTAFVSYLVENRLVEKSPAVQEFDFNDDARKYAEGLLTKGFSYNESKESKAGSKGGAKGR